MRLEFIGSRANLNKGADGRGVFFCLAKSVLICGQRSLDSARFFSFSIYLI